MRNLIDPSEFTYTDSLNQVDKMSFKILGESQEIYQFNFIKISLRVVFYYITSIFREISVFQF
jgi:hypothetical protein